MSYEGYTQYLCAKGHYNVRDSFDDEDHCSFCGGKYVWHNAVDQTNDNPPEFPMDKLLVTPAETCDKCGCKAIDKPAIYRKPTALEVEEYRDEVLAYYNNLYPEVDEDDLNAVYDEDNDCDDEYYDEVECFSAYRARDEIEFSDCPEMPPLKTKEEVAREMSDCIETCGLKGTELYAYIFGMLDKNMDLKT